MAASPSSLSALRQVTARPMDESTNTPEEVVEETKLVDPATIKPSLQKEIRELNSRKEDANRDLDAVLASINSAKREKGELEDQLDIIRRRKEGDERIADEHQVRRLANEEVLDAQTDTLRAQNTEVAAREARVAELKREEAEFDARAGVREANERARIDALLTEERKSLTAITQKVEAEQAELDRIRVDYDKTVEDYQALVNNETQIKQRIASLEKEADAVLSTIESRRSERKQIEDQITALQAQKDELQKDIDSLNADMQAKTDQKAALEKERQAAQVALEAKAAELDARTKDIFVLAERERKVNQREDYIKGMYAKAGITYS